MSNHNGKRLYTKLIKLKYLDGRRLTKYFNEITRSNPRYKMGKPFMFNIGGKMFLVTSPDVLPSPSSFKVPEEAFYEIISEDGFSKHAYLGRHHCVHLDDINRLNKKEWEHYIKQSYKLVASKLSAKFKKQIGPG